MANVGDAAVLGEGPMDFCIPFAKVTAETLASVIKRIEATRTTGSSQALLQQQALLLSLVLLLNLLHRLGKESVHRALAMVAVEVLPLAPLFCKRNRGTAQWSQAYVVRTHSS